MGSVHVFLAGGGTGGHLFPGVAVAHELTRRHPQIQVVFVGSGRALETQVLSREGFALEKIRTGGLVGQSWGKLARGLTLIPVSLLDAAGLVRGYSPRLVVGLGGYSSGPVVLWAALSRIPTMLMEQNTVPGMTNRWLARVVRASALSSDAALPYFPRTGFVSGNPVRPRFFDLPTPSRAPEKVHVLIIGGSQGAHAINVAMVNAAPALAASTRGVLVTHQAGEHDVAFVRDGYQNAGLVARVEPFFEEMDQEMATADLIVCRAGATTLAEVAAAGRPAILVPFSHATHDHQRRNAAVAVDARAAEAIDPNELTGELLGGRIAALASDDERRASLAAASRRLARPDAAAVIVDRMERLLGLEDRTAATPERNVRSG